MIPLSLPALADVVGGDLVTPTDRTVTGVSIDSRTVVAGDLFVPLPGEHVDGHDFAARAMDAGAAGWLCAADRADLAETVPGAILVDDPLDALTGLAAWVRDEVDPIVVAITGSNGKTTTKDMAAAAIGEARVTVANPGSFNNDLGVPLTLCLLTPDSEVLVCEIGSRGLGHIARMMPLLRPDVSIITTITGAHIGEFGSLETIPVAKGEILEGLHDDGVAIVHHDIAGMEGIAGRAPGRVVTFGKGAAADVHPDDVTIDAGARATITVDGITTVLPRPGLHQVDNAMAALAAADAVGVPRADALRGLASAGVSRWRMEASTSRAGVVVVNDAYNANPQSVLAALDTVAAMACDGRRWAVLGFMAELGEETGPGHRQVGAHAAAVGIDELVVVEARAGGIADGAREAGFTGRIRLVEDAGVAGATVVEEAVEGDVVLVKGSRSAGLEVVAAALLEVDP